MHPMRRFRKSSISSTEHYKGQHRFAHWYRDESVYFITARCRNRFAALVSEEAKAIFWAKLNRYAAQYSIVPLIVSPLDNHYHELIYVKDMDSLGPFIRHVHGALAKLVNDVLDERLKPFWYDTGKQGYFDGIIRSEKQLWLAHRYVRLRAVRHGIVRDWREYRHSGSL
jgi:REP element-mobilizing transposase RayT